MKSAKKFIAAILAVMHILTYSANAQQVINVTEGTTTNVDSVQVNSGETLTINVVNQLGEVCPSCRGILETNKLLNNGAIDIWGILAIIAPSIINNGVITVQGDLLLSNLGINKEQFFAGIAELSKDPSLANGYILNNGEIKNLTQGLLVMVAANGGIHNFGTISSNGGAVALVAGDAASFPLTRDGVLNISLDNVTGVKGQVFDKDGNLIDTKGLVTNSGVIQANGGAVVLQAAGAEALYDSIINHTGIIEAKSVAQENGKIILKSETGNIRVTDATIDASGLNAGEKGGSVQILTKGNVIVDGTTVIDASGTNGGGEILIGADKGVTGDVTAKNVFVGSDVTVKTDAIENGNGGKIIVGAREVALAYGSFSAKGGVQSGNGGFIETSGKNFLDVDGISIDASAANGDAGTWLLDPRTVNITSAGSSSVGAFSGTNPKTWDGTISGILNILANINTPSTVSASEIQGFLNAGTSVVITTTSNLLSTTAGDINVQSAITKTAGAAATLSLIADGAITIGANISATVPGGILNLVLQSGGSISSTAALIITGTTSITAGTNSVSLNNAANNFTGAVSVVSAGDVTLRDTNAIDLGASTISGSLNVTAGGAVTDSGALVVTGATTIAAGAGNDITLNNANNFSSVGITNGKNVLLNDINALALNASTVSGTLGVTTAGAVTDNGALLVTGATTIAAGAGNDITLDNANNFSSVGITNGKNVVLNDINALALNASTVSGTLGVTTAGAITDNGDLVVTGATTLAAGAVNNITLDSGNNDFSTVVITNGNDVTLNDKNAIVLGASTVSGNLNVTTNGAITQSGVVNVNTVGKTATFAAGSGNDITLDTQNNLFKTVAINSGKNVKLKDADSLNLGASTVSGTLDVTTSGDISDSGTIVVNGGTNLTAGATNNITLDEAANDFQGAVKINSGKDVTLKTKTLDFGASTVSGTLNATTTFGGMTDSGNVSVTGTTTLTAGANDITLDNANDFATVNVVSGRNVTVKDVNSLTFGNATLTGSLSLTADSDNNTNGSVLTTGTTSATSVSLSGGTDNNDTITMNGTTTATTGSVVADHAATLNVNADVSAATSLTFQNTATVNLSGDTDLTANNGALSVNTGVTAINLTGTSATTNVFTEHGDAATTLAPITASSNANATVNGDGDVTLGNVNLGTGNLTVNVDNDDDGAMTGTFNDLTVKDLSISGHNLTSGDENLTFNGIINMSGDLNVGGLGILTYNNDVTAKSITIHDIKNRVQLGGNVDLTATNGILSVVTAVASILLAGADGTTNIFDGNGDAAVNLGPITATNNPNLTINSEGDINVTSANIGTGTLTAAVDNDNDGAQTATFGALTSGSASVGGSSNDNLVFNGAVTTNTAGFTVSNANNVGFNSTVNTATTLTQTAGSGTTTFNGNTATVGTNASITTGSIAFSGAGNINANSGTGTVDLTAGTGNITSGTATADVVAGTLNASAVTGIDLDTTVTTLGNANVSGTGAIGVRDTAGGLAVTSATTNDGSITINATGGNLDVTTATSGGGNDINLGTITSGNINVDNVTATGGNIVANSAGAIEELGADAGADLTASNLDLSAVSGIGAAGTIETNATTLLNASVSGTGAIDLSDLAGGLAVTSATTNDGAITINAIGGNLDASTVTAGGTSRNITLSTTTSGNVNVGNVTAAGDNIAVTSAGAIEELGADTNADLTSGTMNLTAVSGIGKAGQLEIDATTLTNASTTAATGTINLSDVAGGLAVTSATTTDGAITINATGGNLDATTVTAGGTGKNINLSTTTSGNVNVGNVTAAGDDITVNSADKIEELGADAGADLTSNTMTLNAVNGIGKTAQLEIDATTLTSANTTGVTGTISLNDVAGGLVVTSATTTDGAITINATTGNLDATTVTAGGTGKDVNLSTTTSGNIRLGTVSALGDTANINSAGTIGELTNDDAGVQHVDLLAGTINLTTGGGDIGAFTSYLDIQPTTLWNATSNGGNIYVSCVGTCPMGQIDAGTGTFYYAGNITDGNDVVNGEVNGGLWNIRAGGAHLDGDNSLSGFIGTSTNWIETQLANYAAVSGDLGRLVATAGTGGIHLSNDGGAGHPGLQVGGISPSTITGLVSTGAIEIYSFSPLVLAANVINNGGTNIDLHAMGAAAADDLTINSGITVQATGGNGNINITAGDDVVMNANSVVTAAGTGAVVVSAGENFTNPAAFDGTADGDIQMNATSAIRSQDGTITLGATQHAQIAEVNADSDATGTQGNVIIEADKDANGVGRIEDTNGASTNVTGNKLTMNAGSGIGVDGANVVDAIETSIVRLALNNSTSGHAAVTEVSAGGNMDIESATQNAASDNLTIRTTNGNLTVLDAVSSGTGVSAKAGETLLEANGATGDLVVNNTVTSTTGKINLDSTGQDVLFSADGDVTATGGAEIEVTALRDITMNAGTVLNANGGGTVGASALGVGIDLAATNGNVTLGSVQTTSTASTSRGDANNAVTINALNGAVIDGGDTLDNIIANAGETVINAKNGIGHGNSIETQIDRLTATNSTSNDIDIRETIAGGALNIVRLFQQAATGRIDVQTLDGTLTVLSETVGGFAGNGVVGLAGEIFLRANGAGSNDDLVLNNQIQSSTGKINLDSSSRDVIADAEGDVTATGGAEIESDSARDITMADGTVWNSNSGIIDMDADRDITIGSLQSTNNTVNAVTVVSQNGQIIDGGDTDTDIVTGTTGAAHLVAKTGIGSANGLETQIGQLAARTQTGNIQLFNTGDMTITSLTDADSSAQSTLSGGTTSGVQITDPANANTGSNFIFVTNNGNLTVNNDVSNLDGGDVSLYSFGNVGFGDMNINANVESIGANGNMRVVSGGDMNMAAGTNIRTQGDGVTSGTGLVAVGAGYDVSGKTRNPDMSVNPVFGAPALPFLNAASLASTSTNGAGSLLDTVKDVNANLTMDETSRISTEGGNIIVDAQNNFTVGRVDADGNAGANGITDGTRGNILAFARNGSILDAEGPGEVGNLDFVANSLTMLAKGSIGAVNNHIEGDAPFLNTFSNNDQFVDMQGNTLTEMNSANGNIFVSATGTILLGHVSAPNGEAHLRAGADILSSGGDETRVTGSNLVELIAGGIVGTTSKAIHTQLNGNPAQLNLSAGGKDLSNGVSIAVTSNVSNAAVNMLATPSGLVLFNNLPIAGASLPGLIGNQAALNFKALVRGLRQYSDIDGNYAADFPGFNNIENLSYSPDISVDTSSLDQIPVRGLTTAPRVVPLPKPAVPTPVQPKQVVETPKAPVVPVLSKEPTPPAVVSIPAKATPSTESKTNEGVPQTPSASN